MKLALESLKLFLHSIPFGSKFNVVSFGSDFELLFPRSMECNQDILDITQFYIKDFNADMGGTEILAPL